ncbi:MAG: CHAT domain-containing protein [Cyanobacteria bacterium J06632_22]
MPRVTSLSVLFATGVLGFGSLSLSTPAYGQSITSGDDRTLVNQTGDQYNISGGISAGQNRFHSFDQFGLSAGELANFLSQPDVLNILARINGGDPSVINGTLQITGSQANLFLLNPSGVLFGPNVVLNLPGNLTATTANSIDFGNGSFDVLGSPDYALLTGSPQTLRFSTETPGAVVNAGDLQLGEGRSLILAGGTALNTGTVTVPGGEVAIAAVPGTQLIRLSPSGSLLSYDVASGNGGLTGLSLPELLTGSGVDTGTTVENNTVQVASDAVTQVAIPTAIGTVIVSGRIDVSGPEGGTLAIIGDTTGAVGALLTAAGTDTDGGNIYIGGSRTGDGPLPNASITYLDANTMVDASGAATGGEIIVWANQATRVDGQLLASGSQQGGFVETSSLGDLAIAQAPDISATNGTAGTWLIDPLNLTIGNEDANVSEAAPFTPTGNGANLSVETLLNALNTGANVVVTTTGTEGPEAGDIVVEQQIDTSFLTQAASLSIEAAGSIILEAPIGADTTAFFPLTLRLIADADGTGDGQVSIAGLPGFTAINTNGGDLTIRGNTSNQPGVNAIALTGEYTIQTADFATGLPGGDITIEGTASTGTGIQIGPNVFIDTGGGDFTATGSSTGSTGISIEGFIDLFGSEGRGDIVLEGRSPGLGILVTSGLVANNVTLTSDSDLVVDILNGTGDVNATAADDFRATGTAVLGEVGPTYSVVSIDGAVVITHGGNGVVPFTVGDSTTNGTEAAIRTTTEAIEPDQSFIGTEVQGKIAIVTGETTPEVTTTTTTTTNCVVDCALPPTFSNGNRPRIETDQGDGVPPLTVVNTDNGDVFGQLIDRETGYTGDFLGYLGLNEEDFPQPDLPALQEYLNQVAEATGIRPALLYVSFVPEGRITAAPETVASGALEPAATLSATTKAADSPEIAQFSSPERSSQPDDILELILVTPDSPPIRRTVSISQDQVQRVASQLRGEVTNRTRTRTRTYLRPAQQLHSWLIDPMSDLLTEAEIGNIAFVMPAGLRSLPVSALHNGESFLVERYSVGLMPSVSLTDLRYVDVRDSEVLAMGASSFTDQPSLPAVPVELQAIAERIWPGEFLLNETFTPELLVSSRQQTPYGIVHLATHGEFKSGNIDNSYIQFWNQRVGIDQVRSLGLNNPPVELMVLSACRTALGNEEAELGFAGLAVQAGVKTAMASLWKVDDVGTAGIMTQFYSSLRDEPIKAEALRQAQLAMINGDIRVKSDKMAWSGGEIELPDQLKDISSEEFDHPFFWAAFTTIGSPW